MQAEMVQLLKRLLLSPASELEFLISAALGAAAFVLILNKVGTAMDLSMAQTGRSAVVLVVFHVIGLAVVAAVERKFHLPGWGLLAVVVGVVLVVGAPVTTFLLKGSYFSALVALCFSIGAALVVVTISHTVGGAFDKGEQSVGRGLDHNRETRQFLEQ